MEPVLLDVVERPDLLSSLVEQVDVVVSLLPYSLHHIVGRACIDAKVGMGVFGGGRVCLGVFWVRKSVFWGV